MICFPVTIEEVSEYKMSFAGVSVDDLEAERELFSRGIFEIFISESETNHLNKSSSSMYRFLFDSLGEDSSENKELIEDIIENNFPLLIERYYGNIKREMLGTKSFTFQDWENINFRLSPSRISELLGAKKVIDDNLLFYQKLEQDPRVGESKKFIYESPFDHVYTKEDYVRISVLLEMMIRTYTIENVMKSLFSFKAFSDRDWETVIHI